MSRRRVAKDAERDLFLQANPVLIEYDTYIAVAQDDSGRHVLSVTMDDADPVLTQAPDFSVPDLISIERVTEGPNFELGAYANYTLWGREFEGRGYVALSDLGIGVSSTGDLIQAGVELLNGNLDLSDIQKFGTASSNEGLRLSVDEIPLEGDNAGDFDHGGQSVSIEFDIVSGEGTVEIVLTDEETGEETIMEFATQVSTGGRRGGTELVDHIDAIMREGRTFEEVEIRTTGDLEINVVGIDMTTGYVELGDVI